MFKCWAEPITFKPNSTHTVNPKLSVLSSRCKWSTFGPLEPHSQTFRSPFLLQLKNQTTPCFPSVGIMPVAEYVYSDYVFWSWGNNHRMGLGTHCKMDLSWNPMDHLNSISTFSDWWATRDIWGLLELVSVQRLWPVIPPKVWLFPIPHCTVSLVKGCQSLWGKTGRKINSIDFRQCTRVLPQGGPGSPSVKGFGVYKVVQVGEVMEGPRLCFYGSCQTFIHLT